MLCITIDVVMKQLWAACVFSRYPDELSKTDSRKTVRKFIV